MIDPALAHKAEALLDDLCCRFPMGYRPKIEWRGYRVTAGMAYYRIGIIGLSERVLKDFRSIEDTLAHEYAHLLAVKRHGMRAAGHGAGWRQAMIDLGQEPRVRHTYTVERNIARQKVVYQCIRCGKAIERSRKLPGKRRYVHVKCGGDLRLLRIERVTDSSSVS